MKYSNIIMGQIVCPCVYVLMYSLIFGLVLVPTFSYSQLQSNVYFDNFVSKAGKFSIDYPKSWTIKEKNRFDEPDAVNLTIYKEGGTFAEWRITFGQSNISVPEVVQLMYDRDPGNKFITRNVEPINLTKYTIDGEAAATYISAYKSISPEYDIPIGAQVVVTKHNGTIYAFQFASFSDEFDSPELTNIREHMLESIRWLA
jgi:hypothetical protein